jgi:hypothetical protein
MSAPAKRGPPVAAAAKLGLTVSETEAVSALAFMTATGPESDPIETLQNMAAVWRTLTEELCPKPSPRPIA